MRRIFRSSVPRRSAVQPSAASVIFRSRSSARRRRPRRARARTRRARPRTAPPAAARSDPTGRAGTAPCAGPAAVRRSPVELLDGDVDALDGQPGGGVPSAAATVACTSRARSGSTVPSRAASSSSTADRAIDDRHVQPAPRSADARAVDELRGRDRRAPASASPSIRIAPRGPAMTCPSRLTTLRRGSEGRQPPLHLGEEARRVLAAAEFGRPEDVERQPASRRHAVELELVERAHRTRDRGRAILRPDDELGDQRVVVGRDRRALLEMRVDPNAGPERRPEARDRARARARSRATDPRR